MDISLLVGIFSAAVFIYSVVAHELSHGLMANSLGDPTPRLAGRLTLNPIRHLDLLGSFIIPVLLILGGSPIVAGYAKPMPYNPELLSDRRYGSLKVALAGPLTNIALAVIFGLILRFLPDVFSSTLPVILLKLIVQINLVLAVFNLFPVPPLDGHHALDALLPPSLSGLRVALHRYSIPFLILFIWFLYPYIFTVTGFFFRLITGLPL